MAPTMCRTLGVKGHRPVVGTWDRKDLPHVSASISTVDGRSVSNTLESPARAKQKTGLSKTRRMQQAFAGHLRHVARAYPAEKHQRVVPVIDDAPWHRGGLIDEVLAEHPHLEFKRLPSYGPQLKVIERFWKLLRRRATHNRLFDDLASLNGSPRASLRHYQTVKKRVCRLIAGCYAPPEKSTESTAS